MLSDKEIYLPRLGTLTDLAPLIAKAKPEIDIHGVRVSNPDRELFPGIRKRDLHIFTHPETRALASQRGQDIAAGLPLRDMFGKRP